MRTLIVEDDFTSRLLLQELLKPYGPCHIAVNGREALQAVRQAHQSQAPYELICMDIMMPGMDGQEALQQIRADEEALGIVSSEGAKIMMTTAMSRVQDVSSAYNRLCDAYLTKPIQKSRLIEELRRMALVA